MPPTPVNRVPQNSRRRKKAGDHADDAMGVGASANPFATRFTAPGKIPYFFQSPDEFEKIRVLGQATNWTAQIVGPHGSGKTTLVRHLISHLRTQFDAIEILTVRGVNQIQRPPQPSRSNPQSPHPLLTQSISASLSQPPFPAADSNRSHRTGNSVLVIDGIEKLSWLQRRLLFADRRRNKQGLIVTTHRRLLGLPVLFKTGLTEKSFCKVLRHLGCQQYAGDYRSLSAQHNDNCREMLFALYDQHIGRPTTTIVPSTPPTALHPPDRTNSF